MKRAKAQIFLCYGRQDRQKVQRLYEELANLGYQPWMDVKDILPGEVWETSIRHAIRRADFFLACISSTSVNRRGFLQKEIREALEIWKEKLEEDIYFIPARLEECEVPQQMSGFQWVDLFEQQGLARLSEAIATSFEKRQEEKRQERLQTSESKRGKKPFHKKNSKSTYKKLIGEACNLFGGRGQILKRMTELARYELLKLPHQEIPLLAQQLDLPSETLFAILKRESDVDVRTFERIAHVMDLSIQEALGRPHFNDETREYWYRQYSQEAPLRLVGATGGDVSIPAANALTLDMYVTLRAIADIIRDSKY